MIDVNAWELIPDSDLRYFILISENSVKSFNKWKYKVLKPWILRYWHIQYWIKILWKTKSYWIHQIVARLKYWYWTPEWMEVLHWDWNPKNNYPDNLRYGTRKENIQESIRHWTFKKVINWSEWNFLSESRKSISINQYTLDWEFIQEWDCIKSAIISLWYKQSWHISACCKWNKKTFGWFTWKYKNK